MSPAKHTTEQRVRRAALTVFVKKGYSGASIRDIAKAAGLSTAVLYHYMASKEDLLVAVVTEAMHPLLDGGREIDESGGTGIERFGSLVRHHVTMHTSSKAVWDVVDEEWRRFGKKKRQPIVELRDVYQGRWERALNDAVEEGAADVEDVKMAVFAVLAMSSSVYKWFSGEGAFTVTSLADLYVSMALKLVGATPDGRSGGAKA
jgi:AcrR family transcriptional regulator